jgi:hypothetical protein
LPLPEPPLAPSTVVVDVVRELQAEKATQHTTLVTPVLIKRHRSNHFTIRLLANQRFAVNAPMAASSYDGLTARVLWRNHKCSK